MSKPRWKLHNTILRDSYEAYKWRGKTQPWPFPNASILMPWHFEFSKTNHLIFTTQSAYKTFRPKTEWWRCWHCWYKVHLCRRCLYKTYLYQSITSIPGTALFSCVNSFAAHILFQRKERLKRENYQFFFQNYELYCFWYLTFVFLDILHLFNAFFWKRECPCECPCRCDVANVVGHHQGFLTFQRHQGLHAQMWSNLKRSNLSDWWIVQYLTNET